MTELATELQLQVENAPSNFEDLAEKVKILKEFEQNTLKM
jgi:hypothetical protein